MTNIFDDAGEVSRSGDEVDQFLKDAMRQPPVRSRIERQSDPSTGRGLQGAR